MLTRTHYEKVTNDVSMAKLYLERALSVFRLSGDEDLFWVRELVDAQAICDNTINEAEKITEGGQG